MQVVISDSSCLIDLRKTSLLDAFFRLPYELLIPNTLFDEELFKFTAAQKKAMLRGGLKVVDLPGESVLRAQRIARELPHLSVHDCFAYTLAESRPGCILLTGDGPLRAFARRQKIEVHGVLWVIDAPCPRNHRRGDTVDGAAGASKRSDSAPAAAGAGRIPQALRGRLSDHG